MKQTLLKTAPVDHGRRNVLRGAGLLVAASGIGLAIQERPGDEESPLETVQRLSAELAAALHRLEPGLWLVDGSAKGGFVLVRNRDWKGEGAA